MKPRFELTRLEFNLLKTKGFVACSKYINPTFDEVRISSLLVAKHFGYVDPKYYEGKPVLLNTTFKGNQYQVKLYVYFKNISVRINNLDKVKEFLSLFNLPVNHFWTISEILNHEFEGLNLIVEDNLLRVEEKYGHHI